MLAMLIMLMCGFSLGITYATLVHAARDQRKRREMPDQYRGQAYPGIPVPPIIKSDTQHHRRSGE